MSFLGTQADVSQSGNGSEDIEEDSVEEAGEEEIPTIVADLRVKLRLEDAEKRGDAWKSRALDAEKLLRERVSREHFNRHGWDDEGLFSMDWWEEHPCQLIRHHRLDRPWHWMRSLMGPTSL